MCVCNNNYPENYWANALYLYKESLTFIKRSCQSKIQKQLYKESNGYTCYTTKTGSSHYGKFPLNNQTSSSIMDGMMQDTPKRSYASRRLKDNAICKINHAGNTGRSI